MVAVMGNWFGPQKRGLIMGIWAAHMSVGNIVGSLLGAQMLQYGWVRPLLSLRYWTRAHKPSRLSLRDHYIQSRSRQ